MRNDGNISMPTLRSVISSGGGGVSVQDVDRSESLKCHIALPVLKVKYIAREDKSDSRTMAIVKIITEIL